MVSWTPGTPTPQIVGHLVMEDLLTSNTKMLPDTINPICCEGPAQQWHRQGLKRKAVFDTSLHNFGRA
eukprot:5252203-Ditylum_brightwellii.AAC.1